MQNFNVGRRATKKGEDPGFHRRNPLFKKMNFSFYLSSFLHFTNNVSIPTFFLMLGSNADASHGCLRRNLFFSNTFRSGAKFH